MSIFFEVFLECPGEIDEGLASAELRTLHHALLVEDKEVSTAGQDVAVILTVHPGGALGQDVLLEPSQQLAQVSGNHV